MRNKLSHSRHLLDNTVTSQNNFWRPILKTTDWEAFYLWFLLYIEIWFLRKSISTVVKAIDITIYYHYVKRVRIRSYSALHFPAFGLNTERYSLHIQSKCGDMRTRITSNTDTLYEVYNFVITKFPRSKLFVNITLLTCFDTETHSKILQFFK